MLLLSISVSYYHCEQLYTNVIQCARCHHMWWFESEASQPSLRVRGGQDLNGLEKQWQEQVFVSEQKPSHMLSFGVRCRIFSLICAGTRSRSTKPITKHSKHGRPNITACSASPIVMSSQERQHKYRNSKNPECNGAAVNLGRPPMAKYCNLGQPLDIANKPTSDGRRHEWCKKELISKCRRAGQNCATANNTSCLLYTSDAADE